MSGEPFETLSIAQLFSNTAHKNLNWPSIFVVFINLKYLSKFCLWNGSCFIDFVSQNDNGNILQFLHFQDALKLYSTFLESFGVTGINKVDNSIHIRNIVSPCFSGSFVTSEIPCLELSFS